MCGHHDNTLAVLHAMAEGKLRPATRAGVLGRPLAAMLRLDPAHRPGTGAVERALRSRGTAPFVPAPRAAAVPAPRVTGTAEVPVRGSVGRGAGGATPPPRGRPPSRRPRR